jgi:hypothetical protein
MLMSLFYIANSWDDVKGPNNESLQIGHVSLTNQNQGNKEVTTYHVDDQNCIPPREVKAAMHLLLRLQFCEGTNNHLLHEIVSHPGVNLTNQCLTNKHVVGAFINMLNLNLTFNDFTYHQSPPTSMDLRFKDKCEKLLTHNNKIIVHYVRSTNVALFDRLFKKGITTQADLAAIMSSRENLSR